MITSDRNLKETLEKLGWDLHKDLSEKYEKSLNKLIQERVYNLRRPSSATAAFVEVAERDLDKAAKELERSRAW